MDVERSSRFPRFIANSFQASEAFKEIGDGDPGLHPRERGADAEVDAMAKSDVRIGVARNVEFVRPFEVFRVTIGRPDNRKNQLARQERLTAKLDLSRGCAHHPLQRCAIPQGFFDRGRQKLHVGSEHRKLAGIFQQGENGIINKVGSGFLSGDDGELEEAEYFIVRQTLAIYFRGYEVAEQVVLRRLTAFGDHRGADVGKFLDHASFLSVRGLLPG